MPAAVWGLDLGHSSIKAVRLERAGSIAELTNFDVIEIEPSEDENTRPARVQAALTELLKRRRIGQEPVIVAVSGNQSFFRPFSLPSVTPSKLPEVVKFEARQQIPFPINEVIWDYKRIAPGEGGETRVGLVAVRRDLVEQLIGQIRSLGLRLEAIQVAPLALYNLVQYEFGTKDSWLVLDAGARVTDFVVADGDEFWFRPLPQSGNDFTRALEQKFRMTFQEAEELKLKMGESKQAQKIFQVIEPMLRNLVGDIQRTIGYYKSIRKSAEITGVLALGGAFKLPGLIEFVEQALDMKVTLYRQMNRIAIGRGVDTAWWQEEVLTMGVALGLGLQGLGLGRVSLELLPEAMVQERLLRRKRPVVAAGVGIALLAGITSLFAARHDLEVARADVGVIDKGLEEIRGDQRAYQAAVQPVTELEQKLATWSRVVAGGRGWVLDCLSELATLKMPSGLPALGPDAGSGNGVYATSIFMSRETPPDLVGRSALDRSIQDWYSAISGHGARGPGAKKRVWPLVAILQGEVAGPAADENPPEASFSHAQSLKTAIEFSSKVYLKGQAAPKVGRVTQSAEDRRARVLTFAPRDGGAEEKIARSSIERLVWFREVILGVSYTHSVREVVPPHVKKKLEEEAQIKGETLKVKVRDYLQFTIAWVLDDGTTELANEVQEGQAP